MIEKSCSEFMEMLSAKSPVPGGGGAAALGGAMGMGLANMVASLTVGKKKYAEYEDEIQSMLVKGMKMQSELLDLVEQDAQVFAPLAAAYGLPTATDEDKAYKRQVLSERSIQATLVPLSIAQKSYEALKMTARISEIGSKMAISDAGCAAHFLKAAIGAAKYNIQINLPAIMDEEFVNQTKGQIAAIIQESEVLTAQILAKVEERL